MTPTLTRIALSLIPFFVVACDITVTLPPTEVKSGPTIREDIRVPPLADAGAVADVTLSFGGGELRLEPGAEVALIEGAATFNVPDFAPEVTVEGSQVRIEQGNLELHGIPTLDDEGLVNDWSLEIGSAPLELHIAAGAYHGEFEFGGLALHELTIADGAADVQLSFLAPNRVEMGEFRYTTGASRVRLSGLGHANFESLTFKAGAGDYTLDFTGDLRREASVSIETGLSQVTLLVPESVAAQLTVQGGLSEVDPEGSWIQEGNTYVQAGLPGSVTLTFVVKMGVGSLRLGHP